MNLKNFGPDCILGRDLKVLLRQSFDSLLQHAIVCRDNIFIQSRQSFLCHDRSLFGSLTLLPCKVYRFIHSMSRQSHVCLVE